MRLLIAATGTPTASGKGYQVRLYHQLLELASRHDLTLLTFGHTSEVDKRLSQACREVVSLPLPTTSTMAAAVANSAHLPLSVGLYRNRRMAHEITDHLRRGDYDIVLLQLVRMAPYLRETHGVPTVLDLLDAAELNMRERARAAALGPRQVLELEARRLGVYEREAIAAASLSLLISRRDFEYLERPPKARVLPNGVDLPGPGIRAERTPKAIIFSGTMSYFPNADAATWFVNEVLPTVHRSEPAATFRIVGRDPTGRVSGLASRPGVTVTGAVGEMSDELMRATVSVCPMRFGSGMQTKILEAMAAGTPVVATTKALAGIPDDLQGFAASADAPEAFANKVIQVLRDPGVLQRANDGVEAIRARHTWRHSAEHLEALLQEVLAATR